MAKRLKNGSPIDNKQCNSSSIWITNLTSCSVVNVTF